MAIWIMKKVLQHVIDVTRQIHNDPEAEIVHVVLLGLSSPEGHYDYNVKLAASRSKAMKQYIPQPYFSSG